MSVHGFSNSTLYATNVDFRGVTPVVDQMTADGQLLIGSSVAPFIRSGLLTSVGSTVDITVGHGTINLETIGGVTTIVGDSGQSVTGAVTLYADQAALNCGSSVTFTTDGAQTATFNVTDSSNNTLLGINTGNLSLTGSTNTGLGAGVLTALTNGISNCSFGQGSSTSITSGTYNSCFGTLGLSSLSGSSYCSAFGAQALANLSSGNYTTGLGYNAGIYLNGAESSSICINSYGDTGVSNRLKIGQATGTGTGELSTSFISGINGNTALTTPLMVVINSSDQLGTMPLPTSGVTSLVGDSGTTVDGAVTLTTGNSTRNCGSTVKFVSGTTTVTLDVMDSSNNLFLGTNAGNAADTGQDNTAVGWGAMSSNSSSAYCVAIGYGAMGTSSASLNHVAVGLGALGAAQGSSDCTALGFGALNQSAHGIQNTAVGSNCLNVLNNSFNANGNVGMGYQCFSSMTGGSRNVGAGTTTGSAYTSTESDNILINSAGVVSESNTLRIGQATGTGSYDLKAAYVQGIAGATISAGSPTPYLTLTDTSDGQIVCPTPVQASAASTTYGSLSVGTALQNTANYPILVHVQMVISAAITGVVSVGVGSTNSPTARAITPTLSGASSQYFSFVVPAKFYAQITTSGTVTVTSTTTFASQIG